MTHSNPDSFPYKDSNETLSDKDRFHGAIEAVFDKAKNQGISPLTGTRFNSGSLKPKPGIERLVVKPAAMGTFVPRELLVERPGPEYHGELTEPRITYFAREQVTVEPDAQGRVLQTSALDPMDVWIPFPGSEFPIGQVQQTGPMLDNTIRMLDEGKIDPTSPWM